MLGLLTDRLVLCPSRDPLPTEGKSVELLTWGSQRVEVVKMRVGNGEPEAFILKFGGAGSRAERAEAHPAEIWPHRNAEIWAVNYPGYGQSSGRASLSALVWTAEFVYDQLRAVAQQRPVLVTGNSIGTTCGLYLAARHPLAGMLLRNPPPLRQLIVGRHGWWNLGLGARLVAAGVPRELDAIANASLAAVPSVFVMSGADRVVPPRFQQQIHQAYAGPMQIVVDPAADHATPLSSEATDRYRVALDWLERQALAHPATPPATPRSEMPPGTPPATAPGA